MSEATSEATASGRRRHRLAITAVALVVPLGLAAWLALGLRSAASDVQAHAAGAETALRATQAAVTSGDLTVARQQVALARSEVDAAHDAAGAPSVRLIGLLPVLGGAVSDLDHMISAASTVTDATTQVVDLYGQLTGKTAGAAPIFASGKIDLVRLQGLNDVVGQIDGHLADAETDLSQVSADLPGTSSLREARDTALTDVVRTRSTLDAVRSFLPLLPKALGSDGPKSYLLAILNQGELRAGGGTPLSVAVVTFTGGAMSIPLHSSVAQLPWPRGAYLSWVGSAGNPWNDPQGRRLALFTKTDFNPDFRSSGFDMVAAWNASGFPPVDGVVALDISAIAGVLRHTGPVDTAAYGQLTADNLGQTLLIDAYRKFATDQVARQNANQALVDAMLSRFTTGSSVLSAVSGLADGAPGRHTQVYVSDPALQAELAKRGLDGSLATTAGDRVAVYSQNGNASKVDVFQQRSIDVRATVAADGSASVTQRITIINATPPDAPKPTARTGYTTTWSGGAYFVYRPAAATSATLTLPPGFATYPWAHNQTWSDDGHGNTMYRSIGWLAPRESKTITLTYQLPAGTFLDSSGALVYTLRAEPQSTYQPGTVTVTVSGPSGAVTTQSQTIDRARSFVIGLS